MITISAAKQVARHSLNRGLLITKKYSPEILTGVGIVSGVVAAVMASKATLQLENVVETMQKNVEEINEVATLSDASDLERKKALAFAYTNGTLAIAKLYTPSISLAVGSVACVIGAHGIMRRRNVALIAAYKAVETSFAAYRQRVEDEFGEQKDREIARGMKTVEGKDEAGKKQLTTTVTPDGMSQYAKFFDELNPNWNTRSENNLMYVRCQQNMANDILHARGHIFLNEVYTMLGLPHTPAGQLVGWIHGEGDNCVDFGVYDITNERAREFVNGYEKAIWLDFNVDGIIYDLI